jgi:electron transfer flavoprotein beta subunit
VQGRGYFLGFSPPRNWELNVPYDSIVCIKQVPDTANVTADAMKADGTVNRAALPTIFNPDDLRALEIALQVRDQHGGTVTVISMGPPKAADALRECLYRGADRVVLLTDRRAAASDTLATSYILARAIKTVGRYDFVFCGRQAIDGDTAQVGPQCAEKLGIPQVTYLEKLVELRDRTARIRRRPRHGARYGGGAAAAGRPTGDEIQAGGRAGGVGGGGQSRATRRYGSRDGSRGRAAG